ncbi:MAG: hypothetical protein R3F53_09520 [Gammaproteobacteria bacterium]
MPLSQVAGVSELAYGKSAVNRPASPAAPLQAAPLQAAPLQLAQAPTPNLVGNAAPEPAQWLGLGLLAALLLPSPCVAANRRASQADAVPYKSGTLIKKAQYDSALDYRRLMLAPEQQHRGG